MHLFYYPDIEDNHFTLNRNESAHCVKVLRLGINDIIYLTDGKGKLCRAKIIIPDKKACTTEIIEVSRVNSERDYKLHIAISPTKNIERFEWFLEKATEIGIDMVIPLMCNNSERRIIKEDRLKKVMVAAMKQSLKSWLPAITPFMDFDNLVKQQFTGYRYLATGSEPLSNHLGNIYIKKSDVLIFIGPEGDFREEEMELSRHHGIIPVSLGESRLRTETAGVVACHTINLVNSLT